MTCSPPAKADEWLAELRSKGWFPASSSGNVDSLATASYNIHTNENSKETSVVEDAFTLDENDFKHRVAVL